MHTSVSMSRSATAPVPLVARGDRALDPRRGTEGRVDVVVVHEEGVDGAADQLRQRDAFAAGAVVETGPLLVGEVDLGPGRHIQRAVYITLGSTDVGTGGPQVVAERGDVNVTGRRAEGHGPGGGRAGRL